MRKDHDTQQIVKYLGLLWQKAGNYEWCDLIHDRWAHHCKQVIAKIRKVLEMWIRIYNHAHEKQDFSSNRMGWYTCLPTVSHIYASESVIHFCLFKFNQNTKAIGHKYAS